MAHLAGKVALIVMGGVGGSISTSQPSMGDGRTSAGRYTHAGTPVRMTAVAFAIALLCAAAAAPALCGSGTGTISGVVRIEGQVPQLAPVEVTRDRDVCKDVSNESLVVGPDQSVQYAVITAQATTPGAARAPEHETGAVYALNNSGCRFVPHVLAMQVDGFIELTNSDPILHTAHALFFHGQPQFNVGLYPARTVRKPIVTPGVVKVVCEVHPWMFAYIVVTTQPYYAVTDIHGKYEIDDVPPGRYRLKLWHELLGTQESTIEVGAGKTTEADFTVSGTSGGSR